MTARVRFHLDEHVSSQIAAALKRRNIDVTTTAEAGLSGASDREQLAFATGAGRVMVTQDSDFLRLHSEGVAHAGIAYCSAGAVRSGQTLHRLILIHDVLTGEEMTGRIEFL